MRKILLLLIFTFSSVFSYSQMTKIEVSGTEVSSDRENILIHQYARTLLDYEDLRPSQVRCLKDALLLTGFFDDVSIDLMPDDERFKEVWIKPVWRKDWDKAVIREILFNGYEKLDRNRLYKKLAAKGLHPGVSFCSFSERNAYGEIQGVILDEVESLAREDAPEETESVEGVYPIVWVGIEKMTGDDVRIVVSSSYECK